MSLDRDRNRFPLPYFPNICVDAFSFHGSDTSNIRENHVSTNFVGKRLVPVRLVFPEGVPFAAVS